MYMIFHLHNNCETSTLLAKYQLRFSLMTILWLTSMQRRFLLLHSAQCPWARCQEGPQPLPAAAESFLEADRLNTWPRLDCKLSLFLKLSCFFNDPVDVGNLISGSSAFSKSSLNLWKFTVHILLNALDDL